MAWSTCSLLPLLLLPFPLRLRPFLLLLLLWPAKLLLLLLRRKQRRRKRRRKQRRKRRKEQQLQLPPLLLPPRQLPLSPPSTRPSWELSGRRSVPRC